MKDSIVQIKNKNPKLFTFLAQLVSYVFHPIFMPTAMAMIIFYLNPISFIAADSQQKMVWIGNIALNTFFFPTIFVLLLKALGFIESLKMDIQKERIIPLIGTMVFYFWAYHIFRNIDPPFILRVFLLGCFWGIIVVFMINIFLKISMHTAAAGGAVGIILVLLFIGQVNILLPFLIAMLVAGVIGTARMFLKAHNPKEIWIGYLSGICVQVGAYFFLTYM